MLTTPSRMTVEMSFSTSNQTLGFEEWNGSALSSANATVTSGTKYPHDVLDELCSAMNTASPYGASYGWVINHPTGTITISGGGGTMVSWRPLITAADPGKILTGGDVAAAAFGKYHLGWSVDISKPPLDTQHTSDKCVWGSWEPAYPPNSIDSMIHTVTSASIDNGGNVLTYDFSPDNGRKSYEYGWTFIDDRDYEQLQEFWLAARGGSKVAFFPDRTSSSFVEYILMSDGSLRWDRLSGYPLFEGTLEFAEVV